MSKQHINSARRMNTILREVFLPKAIGSVMGRILGALSIFALFIHTYQSGLSDTFHAFLRYYDKVIAVLLGWVEPYLAPIVDSISKLVDIHIKLSPNWRHVFVVLFVLFIRDAGVAFSDRRFSTASVRMLAGLSIAVGSSLLATVDFIRPSNLLWNLQIAVVPYLGIYLYDITMYVYAASVPRANVLPTEAAHRIIVWRQELFRSGFIRASCRLGIVLCVIALSFCLPQISIMAYPKGGLLVLGIATFANLSYWVYRGLRRACEIRAQNAEQKDVSWMVLFKASEAGRFALAITGVFVWFTTFITLNAGFGILGL